MKKHDQQNGTYIKQAKSYDKIKWTLVTPSIMFSLVHTEILRQISWLEVDFLQCDTYQKGQH